MAPLHPTFQLRHRRRSSGAADKVAADDAARRPVRRGSATVPSATATGYGITTALGMGRPRSDKGWIDLAVEKPQVAVGIGLTVVFLSGVLLSLILGTSIQTSHHIHVHNLSPERAAYFARKGNFLNRYFVKRAWGWTTGLYLLHLWSSPRRPTATVIGATGPGRVNPVLHPGFLPPTRRSRTQRLAALILATLAWIMFTSWAMGPGIGDRIIAATGGTCTIPLPANFDPGSVEHLLPEGFPTPIVLHHPGIKHQPGSGPSPARVYLPVAPNFCADNIPINEATHPTLYALFASAHEAHAKIHEVLRLPPPRWTGGFDISGHAFLLTLGALLLTSEVAPSWRTVMTLGPQRSIARLQSGGIWGLIHGLSTLACSALIGVWTVMLFFTALYFHDVEEKLAGLGLGIVAATLVHFFIPRGAGKVIEYKLRGPRKRPTRPLSALRDDRDPFPVIESDDEAEVVAPLDSTELGNAHCRKIPEVHFTDENSVRIDNQSDTPLTTAQIIAAQRELYVKASKSAMTPGENPAPPQAPKVATGEPSFLIDKQLVDSPSVEFAPQIQTRMDDESSTPLSSSEIRAAQADLHRPAAPSAMVPGENPVPPQQGRPTDSEQALDVDQIFATHKDGSRIAVSPETTTRIDDGSGHPLSGAQIQAAEATLHGYPSQSAMVPGANPGQVGPGVSAEGMRKQEDSWDGVQPLDSAALAKADRNPFEGGRV